MSKGRLTKTAVLATLLTSAVAPNLTYAAEADKQAEIDQNSELDKEHNDEGTVSDDVVSDTASDKTKQDKDTKDIKEEKETKDVKETKEIKETKDAPKTEKVAVASNDTREANNQTDATSAPEQQTKVASETPAPQVQNNQQQSSSQASASSQAQQSATSNAGQSSSSAQQNQGASSHVAQQQHKPQYHQAQQHTPVVTQHNTSVNNASLTADAEVSSVPFHVTTNQTGQEFIDSIAQDASEIAAKNDLYASVMIAQACLESGFGSSGLAQAPYYNFFGVKGAYEGQSVSMSTQEDSGSGYYTTTDAFRKYPSAKESFEDYAQLMKKDIYKGAWKSNTRNYEEATAYLTGRYATDHQYAEKLNAIIEAYDLTQYDNYDGSAIKQMQRVKKEEDVFYTIKLGDTLSKIAADNKTTVNELQKNNSEIKDVNVIYADQKIKVGKKVTYKKVGKTVTYNASADGSDNNINAKQGDFVLPLKPNSYTLTSPFGGRTAPNAAAGNYHEGVDLATPINSSVYAAKDGQVAATGYDPSAGNYIFIYHGNGVYTNYFHLNQSLVHVGDVVKAGQMIAKSGNTGNSTGPHLHFGISHRVWGGYVDPQHYLHF